MNWELKNKSESELKKIAKDLYNGLIFTDRSITDICNWKGCEKRLYNRSTFK